jgi:hypothetical protein
MNNSNCPYWLYNEWCVPHDYIYALAYVILILPFFFVWIKMFKFNKSNIKSVLDYCKVALITEVSLFMYNLLFLTIGAILMQNNSRSLGDFLFVLSIGLLYFLMFLFFLTLIFVCF